MYFNRIQTCSESISLHFASMHVYFESMQMLFKRIRNIRNISLVILIIFEPNGLEKSDTCFTNNTFSTATVIINLENYL